jgi:NADH dehydrogenase FAD-containing subunit
LVASSAKILPGSLSDKLRHSLVDAFKKMNIQLQLGQKIVQVEEMNGTYSIKTDTGHVYEANAYIKAVGITIDSSPIHSLGKDMVDEQGCIKVNEFLQLPNHSNIFCAGDVCNADPKKLSRIAENQASVAAENLVKMVQGKTSQLAIYSKSNMNLCVIP